MSATKAEEVFSEAIDTFIVRHAELRAFRETVYSGLYSEIPLAYTRILGRMLALRSFESFLDGLRPPEDARVTELPADEQQRAFQHTGEHIVKCYQFVDALVVIVLHSVFEICVLGLCKAISLVNVASFRQLIQREKVELQNILEEGIDSVQETLVCRFLRKLERDSLKRKCEVLNSLCRRRPNGDDHPGYRYDDERIAQFDRVRHRVVHSTDNVLNDWDLDAGMKFIADTFLFFTDLVRLNYGLRWVPVSLATKVNSMEIADETTAND